MANLYPVAGSKIFIGGRKTAKGLVTAADFSGETWVRIMGWTQAGALGDSQEVINQSVIDEGRVRKMKGLLDGGSMENTFLPDGSDPGQAAFKAAIKDCKPYAFKVEWGANCPDEAVVTATAASPSVIGLTNHGLVAGQAVVFTTTGALPAGLVPGTTYYVLPTGLTANNFTVSLTPGGAAVGGTTPTGSGTHTVRMLPVGQTEMFFGLALPGSRTGGEGNASQLRSWTIAVDSNIVEA